MTTHDDFDMAADLASLLDAYAVAANANADSLLEGVGLLAAIPSNLHDPDTVGQACQHLAQLLERAARLLRDSAAATQSAVPSSAKDWRALVAIAATVNENASDDPASDGAA